MNEKIKQHVKKYNESKGWPTDNDSLIETINEANSIWTGNRENHRWWDEIDKVVEIDGMLIKFVWAEANRDESIFELGWDFDESSIHEVRPREVKTIIYEPVD